MSMRAAHVVEIVTPKRYILNGLWFGPKKPSHVIVWVHGLGSSMFSKLSIVDRLIGKHTAVLVFNNRGHDKVAYVPHVSGTFNRALRGGAAHERFTDCVDDIQGAINFVRRQGVKNIFLAGHSTGCQKSAYWASKKGRGVKGIILLAPMSDYSAIRLEYNSKKIEHALSVARACVRKSKGNKLLPAHVWDWPWIADAQRFLSLYSGKGTEEVFTYWKPMENPRTLKSIRTPVLVLLAEKDEYADRSARKIGEWFEGNLKYGATIVVPRVKHNFRGAEKELAETIREWMKTV